jgi:[acyl-carrier-protein] S-malonyltransferase
MCAELWQLPAARRVLDRLSSVLGDDLEVVTTRMPAEDLSLTFHAQRAIHAHHLGHWFAFREKHPEVGLDGAIGHSVGVVAALVAAGSLSLEDSGRFILERARAFSEVCARLGEPSGLASVATENLRDVEDELAAFPRLTLALVNSIGKGAVGGPLADLEAFEAKAREEGWPVRVQILRVQGPYHTAAFEACRGRLEEALGALRVRAPEVPVFMGTSGRAETDPDTIKALLAAQPGSRERHLDAVRASYAGGCRNYLEAAAKPQPIHWLGDQLVDSSGSPLPGVTASAVATESIGAPLPGGG